MLYNEGLVVSLDGDYAGVKIVREGACGHDCSKCVGCGGGETTIIARNDARASVGDFVALQGDGIIVRRAFVVYMLPILLFFAGYAIGYYLLGFSEGLCAVAGLVLAAVDVLITMRYSKKQKEKGNVPVITHVL
ncbi:MAG: SoxR reducing system RseC family protein [Clostridia bacterium]|nr:SoxR reducing system RseC family protein [Clostridia bacterium]